MIPSLIAALAPGAASLMAAVTAACPGTTPTVTLVTTATLIAEIDPADSASSQAFSASLNNAGFNAQFFPPPPPFAHVCRCGVFQNGASSSDMAENICYKDQAFSATASRRVCRSTTSGSQPCPSDFTHCWTPP